MLANDRLAPPGTPGIRLVLALSTYEPVRTTALGGLYSAIQKPILEPLCHLMVWFSPVVRALNWLSYLNGSAHRSTERSTFSGQETRNQLDFLARYTRNASPAVIGRGMLAMFRYDAQRRPVHDFHSHACRCGRS